MDFPKQANLTNGVASDDTSTFEQGLLHTHTLTCLGWKIGYNINMNNDSCLASQPFPFIFYHMSLNTCYFDPCLGLV
uniref:Transcription initiation factor TFIID subunit 12b-like n=1 Tax=Rhizophora mucronata TaxID=61149 RepID=A0A2P2KQG8_RHIMU